MYKELPDVYVVLTAAGHAREPPSEGVNAGSDGEALEVPEVLLEADDDVVDACCWDGVSQFMLQKRIV